MTKKNDDPFIGKAFRKSLTDQSGWQGMTYIPDSTRDYEKLPPPAPKEKNQEKK